MDIDIILRNIFSIFFVFNLISGDQIFVKGIKSPSVEIRGVYLPCNQEHKKIGNVHSDNRNYSNLCTRKISISIKLINVGPSQIRDEFLLLNHVFDPITNASSQLLNPIVFKVNQELITEVYDMKYLTRVNGEAKEVIQQGTKTCNHSGSHPVCGSQDLRNYKDFCCICPSTETSKDSRDVKRMSTQLQSDSTAFQHTEDSMLANSEAARILKKKDVGDLSEISNTDSDVTSERKKAIYDNSSLKYQMGWDQSNRKSQYFTKMNKRIDNQPYSINKIVTNVSDKPVKTFANYMKLSEDSADIQQTSSIPENAQDMFLKDAHYHSEITDEKNPMHKEKYNFNNRGKNMAKEEPNKYKYEKDYSLNQELNEEIPYNNYDRRGYLLDNSEHKNEIKSEMNELRVSENVLPVKYYEEISSNLDNELIGGTIFHDPIPQHLFKEEDSQNTNATESEVENAKRLHKKNFILIPKGQKLSRINIGIEYEQPKGKDDLNIHLQSSSTVVNKNSYGKGRKNKTCENTFDLHCLTFSKLWYNVYEFKKPTIKHIVELEIFERHYSGKTRNNWIDHTKGKVLRVGSIGGSNENQFDGSSYYKVLERKENQCLNHSTHKLLVPQFSEEIKIPNHSGISEGSPHEYLVLPNHLLSLDGNICDTAGVGVKAFISSKDRCKAEHGSCLRNQPAVLWQKDKDAKKSSGKTEFFLENFGNISNDSFQTVMMEHSLQLGYGGKHISQIDVVVSVELNFLARRGPAQITTVIVDSIGEVPTINVAITNLGLVSSFFKVKLGECVPSATAASKNLSLSFIGYKSKRSKISPLHKYDFTIQLCDGIYTEKTSCIVLVQNEDNKTVSARRIMIEKGARCLCMWHCQCNCIHSQLNLKCRLLPHDELLASGFKGTIPVVLPIIPADYLMVLLGNKKINCLLLWFILFLFLLLLLGLCKVVLGLTYWEELWVAGIPFYYGPKATVRYQKESFVKCKSQYVMTGYPIHPSMKKRSVHKWKRLADLFMNIFMFLLLPFVFLIWWPIYTCFMVFCKNCNGYQWKLSISKFAAQSNNTLETSSVIIPEDTESVQSSSSKERSLEGTPSKSKRKISDQGVSSTPNTTETDYGEMREHSHISFVTYEGTSDEQELRDIDYVMLQMRRSSSALQKARDKTYCIGGGRRIFLGESIDEESSVSDVPSSFDIESVQIFERRIDTNKMKEISRSCPVRDVLMNLDDSLSEFTTKDSLEAVTGLSSNTAHKFVESLRTKKFVFRNIDKIIGGVNFSEGRPYSIRGYFFNAPGGYKFIPPTPLWQYWNLEEDGTTMVQLDPPMNLFATEFEKFYESAEKVVEEGDLSPLPISTCINVQFQHFDEDEFLQDIGKL